MFGVSFQEVLILAIMALLILGPNKLPGALRTVGKSIRKLRNLTAEVRQQSGIDDVLRAEGFDGGLNELRSVMRGGTGQRRNAALTANSESFIPDLSREYPVEGPDIYDALPEDLLDSPLVEQPEPSGDEPEPSGDESTDP